MTEFIEWNGVVSPDTGWPPGLSGTMHVDVKMRDEREYLNRPVDGYCWLHNHKFLTIDSEIVGWRVSTMSTITPPCEPHKDGHTLLPMWLVSVFAKEDQAFGETYYVRAATPQLGVIRALALHPVAFEKLTVEHVDDTGGEVGHGLDNNG